MPTPTDTTRNPVAIMLRSRGHRSIAGLGKLRARKHYRGSILTQVLVKLQAAGAGSGAAAACPSSQQRGHREMVFAGLLG
ncbi:MAG: hypothetical protein P0111_07865 [Nitrospira sp.]|nr:hypothetical protein [Nitrospira sp.]